MKRSDLEHLIRAAGKIAQDGEIVIIGSQAILGQFPDAPGILSVSAEADVFPWCMISPSPSTSPAARRIWTSLANWRERT
jgi:hypothetical protein